VSCTISRCINLYQYRTGDGGACAVVLICDEFWEWDPVITCWFGGGKYLPKAGMWMIASQAAFGVILLGVQIVLVSRIVSETLKVCIYGRTLYCLCCTFFLLFQSVSNGWGKNRQGLCIDSFIYGVALLTSWLGTGSPVRQALGYFPSVRGDVNSIEKQTAFI